MYFAYDAQNTSAATVQTNGGEINLFTTDPKNPKEVSKEGTPIRQFQYNNKYTYNANSILHIISYGGIPDQNSFKTYTDATFKQVASGNDDKWEYDTLNSKYPDYYYKVNPGADGIVATQGSIDIGFVNDRLGTFLEFPAVPGKLDTDSLSNGDYANVVIVAIFEQLKNYGYNPDTIFDNIQNVLTEFFVAYAISQRIQEIVIPPLIILLKNGEITPERLEMLIEKASTDEYSKNYGQFFVNNFDALKIAIENNKGLLNQ